MFQVQYRLSSIDNIYGIMSITTEQVFVLFFFKIKKLNKSHSCIKALTMEVNRFLGV